MNRAGAHVIALAVLLAGCRTTHARPASVSTTDTTWRAPDGSPVPPGPLGMSIRRGRALIDATRDSLSAHVGNALRCASCHVNDGASAGTLSLVGSYARYPQYRARAGAVQTIENRVNSCFERSLAGRRLDADDPALRDIVTFLAFESRGIGMGQPPAQLAPMAIAGDSNRGRAVYQRECARCHGLQGAGGGPYPPLWGDSSFTIGAGMARTATAAGFIRARMPQDRPGTLDSLDALDVAAYMTSRSRPDFAPKINDWPNGDAPAGVPYRTRAGRRAN